MTKENSDQALVQRTSHSLGETSQPQFQADHKFSQNTLYSLQELQRRAEIYVASGLLPKEVKTWQTAVVLMDMAQNLGIKIQFAGRFFNIIQGQPTLSPKGMMAVIFQSGLLTKYEYRDDGQCAHLTLGRYQGKNKPPIEFTGTFSIEDASKMMTKEYINGVQQVIPLSQKFNWKSMPRVMRKWRALSESANFLFPDIIGGMHTPEEIENSIDIRDSDFTDYDIPQVLTPPSPPPLALLPKPVSSFTIEVEPEIAENQQPQVSKKRENDPAEKKIIISTINRLIVGIQSHKGKTAYATVDLEELNVIELQEIQKEVFFTAGITLQAFLADCWQQELDHLASLPKEDMDKEKEVAKEPAKHLKELKQLIENSQQRLTLLEAKQEASQVTLVDDDVADF